MGYEGLPPDDACDRWSDAVLAAALCATDPATGGIVLRAGAGPVRDRWLAVLRDLLGPETPLRRVPAHVTDDRLLGGLDLAATLQAGKPVVETGILAQAHGGMLLLAMAERLPRTTAARIAAAMDTHEIKLEREGCRASMPARFGAVALDEGASKDERTPDLLADRLAFRVTLDGVATRDAAALPPSRAEVAAARAALARVDCDDGLVEVTAQAAAALGIASVRPVWLAVRAARASAALAGRRRVAAADAAAAARLVLAPRAVKLPPQAEPDRRGDTDTGASETVAPPPPSGDADAGGPPAEELRPAAPAHAHPLQDDPDPRPDNTDAPPDDIDPLPADAGLEERMIAAARAALPPGVMEDALHGAYDASPHRTGGSSGRAGASSREARRGRSIGVRPGDASRGGRLNAMATLRAAAPWQRIRLGTGHRGAAAASSAHAPSALRKPAVSVRREDFRVNRFKQPAARTTIFAIDASGSSALHRLAEAKGAVELLLGGCYSRREHVAVVAFRGRSADLVLPPTRSLARVRRSLNALPGGGATPLAAGIDEAVGVAAAVRHRGDMALLVLLTDGQANIGRDGAPGRGRAWTDALEAARQVRAQRLFAVLIDTAVRPQEASRSLAACMGARYVPLPYADARTLCTAVREASAGAGGL